MLPQNIQGLPAIEFFGYLIPALAASCVVIGYIVKALLVPVMAEIKAVRQENAADHAVVTAKMETLTTEIVDVKGDVAEVKGDVKGLQAQFIQHLADHQPPVR